MNEETFIAFAAQYGFKEPPNGSTMFLLFKEKLFEELRQAIRVAIIESDDASSSIVDASSINAILKSRKIFQTK